MVARFDLGNGEILVANMTKGLMVHNQGVYARIVGSAKGGIERRLLRGGLFLRSSSWNK